MSAAPRLAFELAYEDPKCATCPPVAQGEDDAGSRCKCSLLRTLVCAISTRIVCLTYECTTVSVDDKARTSPIVLVQPQHPQQRSRGIHGSAPQRLVDRGRRNLVLRASTGAVAVFSVFQRAQTSR